MENNTINNLIIATKTYTPTTKLSEGMLHIADKYIRKHISDNILFGCGKGACDPAIYELELNRVTNLINEKLEAGETLTNETLKNLVKMPLETKEENIIVKLLQKAFNEGDSRAMLYATTFIMPKLTYHLKKSLSYIPKNSSEVIADLCLELHASLPDYIMKAKDLFFNNEEKRMLNDSYTKIRYREVYNSYMSICSSSFSFGKTLKSRESSFRKEKEITPNCYSMNQITDKTNNNNKFDIGMVETAFEDIEVSITMQSHFTNISNTLNIDVETINSIINDILAMSALGNNQTSFCQLSVRELKIIAKNNNVAYADIQRIVLCYLNEISEFNTISKNDEFFNSPIFKSDFSQDFKKVSKRSA